jgi:hypothetical protein
LSKNNGRIANNADMQPLLKITEFSKCKRATHIFELINADIETTKTLEPKTNFQQWRYGPAFSNFPKKQ